MSPSLLDATRESTRPVQGFVGHEGNRVEKFALIVRRHMTDPTAIKMFSFGGCDFGRTSPKVQDLSPTTKVLNVEVGFEEALKLHLAIGECIRKLNSYKRSTTAGRRSALNLAIHLSKGRLTINEGRLPE